MNPPANSRRRISRIAVALLLLTLVSVGLVRAIRRSRATPNIQVRFENIEANNLGVGGEFVFRNLRTTLTTLGSFRATIVYRSGSTSNLNLYPGLNRQSVWSMGFHGSNAFAVNLPEYPKQWTAEVEFSEGTWLSEKTKNLFVWSNGSIDKWIPNRLLSWAAQETQHHFSIGPQEIPPPHP